MTRILFFIFLAFVVWFAVRLLGSSRKKNADRGGVPPAAAMPAVEAISPCAWCGVHVPQRDAVTLPDGRAYCCDAHREAAHQAATPTDRPRS